MKLNSSLLLASGMLALPLASSNAATVITSILAAPTGTTFTNQFDTTINKAENLYDGTAPTVAQIGTNRANDGNNWSVTNSINGAEYIVYDMGSIVSFSSILYSQNTAGAGSANWNWNTMKVWVSNTAPGLPNNDSGAGEAAADAARTGLVTTFNLVTLAAGQNLTQYDLTGDGSSISGRYVTFKFAQTTPVAANPGGQDLWLAVPEPSAALLGGLGMLALLRRRR